MRHMSVVCIVLAITSALLVGFCVWQGMWFYVAINTTNTVILAINVMSFRRMDQ